MTRVNDFLALLPIIKDRAWRITRRGEVRDGHGTCPLCALAYEVSGGDVNERLHAVRAILFTFGYRYFDVVALIAGAADRRTSKYRVQLLEALELEEA